MNFGQWVLGAVAGGLALGAVGAQAAPMPRTAMDAPASVHKVQFVYEEYYYDPPPPRYYAPPPPRYYRPAPPPPAFYPPPPGPAYGFYDKDTTKAYRRAEKEIFKERARAWNRANGY